MGCPLSIHRLRHPRSNRGRRFSGFTLVEVLVGMAVLSLMLVMLLSILGQTSNATRRLNESLSALQGARAAYDLITANLGQAVLASYWDYQDANGNFRNDTNRNSFRPVSYGRKSDLHFLIQPAGTSPFPGVPGTGQVVAFQFPTSHTKDPLHAGLEGLLSACAYYVDYAEREPLPSPFPAGESQYRFRLMQALQPSENLAVYLTPDRSWVADLASEAAPIADNVILLLVWPKKSPTEDPQGDSLTQDYTYDSRLNANALPQPETAHQAPPLLQVVMVTIDESSAARLCTTPEPPAAITGLLNGLFQVSTQEQFEADLAELEKRLNGARIQYHISNTTFPILESKMQ